MRTLQEWIKYVDQQTQLALKKEKELEKQKVEDVKSGEIIQQILISKTIEEIQKQEGLASVTKTEAAKPRAKTKIEREELVKKLLDPLLTVREAAKLLNVCTTTVRRYTNKGTLPHSRTSGRQRRFRLSDVLEFIEKRGESL